MPSQDTPKTGKLLQAWIDAGRSKAEFLSIKPESLDDTEETQLRIAGVEYTECAQFLERLKGMIGSAQFSSLTGDFRDRLVHQRSSPDFNGEKIRNPTGAFINLAISRLKSDPKILRFPSQATVPVVSSVKEPEFSRRDKMVLKRIELSNAIQAEPAFSRDKVGFSSRVLVQASLPHSDPGPVEFWQRRNGRFLFVLQPGLVRDKGMMKRGGCPYGPLPRLALIHLASEAVRTKNRRVSLGNSFYQYLHTLGVSDSSLNYASVREQITRLFSSHISFHWLDSVRDAKNQAILLSDQVDARINRPVASNFVLWCDRSAEEDARTMSSFVTLDQDFFDEVIDHGFPVDMDAVAALKRSSMALDLYLWLSWRMVDLRYSLTIPWDELHEQFGADYGRVRKFREKFSQTAEKVGLYWRGGLRHEVSPDGLTISPSPLPVEKRAI